MFPTLQQTVKFLNPSEVLAQVGFTPGMEVADFGCGAGDWALSVSQLVGTEGRVHAIDVQDAALSSVRSRARMGSIFNIDTVRADLELPRASMLADSSQDAAVLSNILFQSSKKERIIEEAARTLKRNGLLLFVDWKKSAPLGPAKELRLDERATADLIARAGFRKQKDIAAGMYHFGMVFTKLET